MNDDAGPTQGQRVALRRVLQERLHALNDRIVADRDGLSRVDHATVVRSRDADDARQRAGEHEVDDELAALAVIERAALSAALARADTAEFGRCAQCGVWISAARLKQEPEALYCIQCQSRLESTASGAP